MIVVVDLGMGNLGSILNMLKKIGVQAVISSKPEEIAMAEKLILPGVGIFDVGMRSINDLGILPALHKKVVVDKVPILGICLGMQLFTKGSEEGTMPGLGWIDAMTIRFNFLAEQRLKVPHMGWNSVVLTKKSRLFEMMEADARFYFVHSYHLVCADQTCAVAKTMYGYDFVSAIEQANILGTQFHPEKSHKFGMRVLKNFAELY